MPHFLQTCDFSALNCCCFFKDGFYLLLLQTTSKTVIQRFSENLEANGKIPEYIHPLQSFSRDFFCTNECDTTLGDQGWKQEQPVVSKTRLDTPSGSWVAAFFGKNRFEMFLKAGYRVRPINRFC